MTRCELVIIGAGPAGMTAAPRAVAAGVRPVVLDENTRPGGQIYRQLPPGFVATDAQSRGRDVLEGGALVRRFLEAQGDYRLDAARGPQRRRRPDLPQEPTDPAGEAGAGGRDRTAVAGRRGAISGRG